MRTDRLITHITLFASLTVLGCTDDVSPLGSDSATSGDDSSTSTGSPTTDPTASATTTSDATTNDATTSDATTGGGSSSDGSDTSGDESSSGGGAVCGDGVVEGREACDDGGESATCNADCSTALCGDGVLNETAGEACDDGGESAACNLDCTVAACGDGVVNTAAGEDCDDTNDVDTDDCLSTCVAASCGDGFVQDGVEECDDGNLEDMDGCSALCESECDEGLLACDGTCIDPATNESFCGGCDTACDPGQACIDETCTAAEVLVVGPSGVVATLQTAGYTVTSVTWPNAAASLDASLYPVAFVGRYATNWASMTPENIAALEAYSAAGGNIVTEWDGASIFFSGYDPTYRYTAGAVTPLSWYSGTVGSGFNLASGTPISQTVPDPLFDNVNDPFSAGGATEYFFTFQNVDEAQLQLLATFEGNGTTNFPAGPLGTIYRGQRCGGNIIFASFDYQDGAGNAGFGDLMGNFVEAALAPPSETTLDVCP